MESEKKHILVPFDEWERLNKIGNIDARIKIITEQCQKLEPKIARDERYAEEALKLALKARKEAFQVKANSDRIMNNIRGMWGHCCCGICFCSRI